MSPDLSTRVRSYAEQIEREVPHVTVAEIEQRSRETAVEPEVGIRRQIPGWAVAIAAAAVVLLIVGVVPWLLRSPGANQPAGPFPSTSVSAPAAPDSPVATVPTTLPAVTESPVAAPDLSAGAWASLPATTELFDSAQVYDVTAFGAGMVAVGSVWTDGRPDAAVWTSPDGLAWSRVPHGEEAFGGGAYEMWAVGSDGDRLVAVGHGCDDPDDPCSMRPTVWTSIDGDSWQRVAHDPGVFGLGGQMADLVAFESGWLSVGMSCDDTACVAAAWSSSDGISWNRTLFAEFSGRLESVTRGNGLFVAVSGGPVAAVWTSSDGVDWARVAHDPKLFGTGLPEGELWDVTMMSVTYNCGQSTCAFTAVGWTMSDSNGQNGEQRARIWASTNGVDWTVAFDDAAEGLAWDAAAEGDTVVVVGSAIWRSVDGARWEKVADTESFSKTVAVGSTNWVSMPGDFRAIWISPPSN